MSYRFEFLRKARNDSIEVSVWYENQKAGLGVRFLAALDKKLDQIERNPEAFGEKSKKGYREAALNIFPYIIVYKIYKKNNVIFINAIHHKSRHPRQKFRK